MAPLNDFIDSNENALKDFLDKVVEPKIVTKGISFLFLFYFSNFIFTSLFLFFKYFIFFFLKNFFSIFFQFFPI